MTLGDWGKGRCSVGPRRARVSPLIGPAEMQQSEFQELPLLPFGVEYAHELKGT
jgi:hypothetical protein